MPRPNVIDVPRYQFRWPRGRAIALGAAGFISLLILYSLWYVVPADSEAIRLRFGKPVEYGILPGLHFKMPLGIDTVDVSKVQRQLKMEFGNEYQPRDATNPYQYDDEAPEVVRNMVTGDLNAAHVEWVVQYHIAELQKYLYHAREPEETLRAASESVMREIIGDRTVDEVLTVGRQDAEFIARDKLSELCGRYELGLAIDQVQLKGVNPPPQVRQAFEDVNRAQQEREEKINMARAEYNKVVPRAKGDADRILSEAEGDALKRVNEANGDAGRFLAVFEEYRKAPAVTRRRLYLETMTEIMPRIGRKVILDEAAGNVLPFLPLPAPAGK